MNNKENILITNLYQFGYFTDYYKWAVYLSSRYCVTYLCFDERKKRIDSQNVNVIYLPYEKSSLKSKWILMVQCDKILRSTHFGILLLPYFPGVSLMSFMNRTNVPIILDVRTGTISSSRLITLLKDWLIYFEHFCFKNYSIISDGVRQKLHFPESTYILTLGADELNINHVFTEPLNLIYVGTLVCRDIDKTVTGLKIFMDNHPNITITYSIISNQCDSESSKIQKLIQEFGLENHVKMIGYIHHDSLAKYLEEANIGVSFIPILPKFNRQPPTKTFEYLLSGLPVIATNTYANRQIINEQNGVIIQDSPENFAIGLEKIRNNFKYYDVTFIKQSVNDYRWDNIIAAFDAHLQKLITNRNA